MQRRFSKLAFRSVIILLITSTISCVPVEKLKYFTDIEELQEPAVNPRGQKLIMPFENLYIKVFSIDEKTNLLFNSSDNNTGSMNTNLLGYLVDEAGNINYPFAGKINVMGLTTAEAALKIEAALNEYVTNAAITVKFIDNNISVLGEVQRQGMFTFNQEKLNIYEALALGGGLTPYGDRKNVILIRQQGNKIVHHRLNLSNSSISDKDSYYVLANDVIVVEPLRNISTSYGNNTFYIIVTSITTLIAILLLAGV